MQRKPGEIYVKTSAKFKKYITVHNIILSRIPRVNTFSTFTQLMLLFFLTILVIFIMLQKYKIFNNSRNQIVHQKTYNLSVKYDTKLVNLNEISVNLQ